MAATAFRARSTLVTPNTRDFAGIAIELLDPWKI